MKRQHHHEPSRANDDGGGGGEKKKRRADEPSRGNDDDGGEKKRRRADEPSRGNDDGDESLLSRLGRASSYKYDELCDKYPEVANMLKELPEAVGFPLSSALYIPKFVKRIFDLSKRPESEARATIMSTCKTMGAAVVVFGLVCLVKKELSVVAALAFLFNKGLLKSGIMTGPAKDEKLAKTVECGTEAEEEKKKGKVGEPPLTEAAQRRILTAKVDAPVKGSGEAMERNFTLRRRISSA